MKTVLKRWVRGVMARKRSIVPIGVSPRMTSLEGEFKIPRSPTLDALHQSRLVLERILTKNIVPFWYPKVVDLELGGYDLSYDTRGHDKGLSGKTLVAQARTLWFFSRLSCTRYGTSAHLDAAVHGYNYLRERMWDHQYGGLFWEVDRWSHAPTKPDKHLYAQAFGLYALSEYFNASGDTSALELSKELFGLVEEHAHDRQHGGFQECLQRDWSPVAASPRAHYMATAPGIKLMNTHLHLLEGITGYFLITQDPIGRERLMELLFILSNSVVRKETGGCADKHRRDWTPLTTPEFERVSYGHDLKNIWLLVKACTAIDVPNSPFISFYKNLFNYSVEHGFDGTHGGFYDSGPPGKPANKRNKTWWVQAEALLSALTMYRLTGEERYYHCFSQTLEWIAAYQVDWQGGEWHAQVSEGGIPYGDKMGPWKSPYHNGRAIIDCLTLLSGPDDSVDSG